MFMSVYILAILTSYCTGVSHCSQAVSSKDNQCPPWSFYDIASKQCVCHDSQFGDTGRVLCTTEGTLLFYTYCMTYDEESDTLSTSSCPYHEIELGNISRLGFIVLPDNISELNEYMCGSVNRKGVVCSECIDGYGPAVTSWDYKCTDCTNAWYGVPLYLVVEIVPVTIFFIIVLIFQLDLTSAPMTGLILFSNFVTSGVNRPLVVVSEIRPYAKLIFVLYGFLSLDFIRFVIPPFCISPNLNIVYIIYLRSLSAILPYIYIAITWILIKLHSRDCKIVVQMWGFFNRVFLKHINVQKERDRTAIDAFATFFLLCFFKISITLLYPILPLSVRQASIYNRSTKIAISPLLNADEDYGSKAHLPVLVLSLGIFLFILLPPIVLIALYPTKVFRLLLRKCCHRQLICTINFFVEKFYFCYKDGLDGGRDKRSFACAYFILVLLSFAALQLSSMYVWLTALYGGYSLIVLIVQPYKKRYMTVLESLILANFALVTALHINRVALLASSFNLAMLGLSITLPLLGLAVYLGFRLLKKLHSTFVFQKVSSTLTSPTFKPLIHCCFKNNQLESGEQGNVNNDEEPPLPDRMVHPQLYELREDTNATY